MDAAAELGAHRPVPFGRAQDQPDALGQFLLAGDQGDPAGGVGRMGKAHPLPMKSSAHYPTSFQLSLMGLPVTVTRRSTDRHAALGADRHALTLQGQVVLCFDGDPGRRLDGHVLGASIVISPLLVILTVVVPALSEMRRLWSPVIKAAPFVDGSSKKTRAWPFLI